MSEHFINIKIGDNNMDKYVIYRSAVTGQIVSPQTAKNNPATHVRETGKRSK